MNIINVSDSRATSVETEIYSDRCKYNLVAHILLFPASEIFLRL